MAKDLIQIDGLLIAFTGIIFTGMLAEVRFRTERASQRRTNRLLWVWTGNRRLFSEVLLRDSCSSQLPSGMRWGTWSAPWDLRQLPRPWHDVCPVVLMLGGVALLMIALAPIASELRLAVARSSESFRQWASRPRPGFT